VHAETFGKPKQLVVKGLNLKLTATNGLFSETDTELARLTATGM